MIEQKIAQDNEVIKGAVDEFIQDKRLWFRDLHKEHASDLKDTAIEKGRNFKEGTALYIGKGMIPVEGDLDEATTQKILKERTVELEQKFQEELEAKGSDYESPSSEEDEKEKWDAETILSTYTNTDNHPSVIKF